MMQFPTRAELFPSPIKGASICSDSTGKRTLASAGLCSAPLRPQGSQSTSWRKLHPRVTGGRVIKEGVSTESQRAGVLYCQSQLLNECQGRSRQTHRQQAPAPTWLPRQARAGFLADLGFPAGQLKKQSLHLGG